MQKLNPNDKVIDILNKKMSAVYWKDGSGQIILFNRGEEFHFDDGGKLKDQIKYLEKRLRNFKKYVAICEKAISILKKEKYKVKK